MHHSLDICCDIAEKLKDPEKISLIMKQLDERNLHYGNGWPQFSFVGGVPGIICFYAMMNLNFENEGWDRVAHDYLKSIKSYLESVGYVNASLFYGLAGLSFSVYLCSDQGKRYGKMLSKLDEILIQEVRKNFLDQLDHYLDPHLPLPSHYYDLASGLSGIISYLLHRDDLKRLAHECIEALVKLLSTPKMIDSHEVFPWFVSSKSEDGQEMNEFFKNGYYRLEIPYGISGVMGVLSQAAMKGVQVNGLFELIATLSEWIVSKQIIHEGLVNWNRFVTLDNQEKFITEKYGNNWLVGAPGVSRCLYLASKALNNKELAMFSENVFLSHLRAYPDLKNMDTSFSLGKAGLLSLVYQMGCETEKPLFFKIAKEIEEELKRCYNPLHEFGFQSLRIDTTGQTEWIDSFGLYDGAIGIGLSLLQAHGRAKSPWNQVFLISNP